MQNEYAIMSNEHGMKWMCNECGMNVEWCGMYVEQCGMMWNECLLMYNECKTMSWNNVEW